MPPGQLARVGMAHHAHLTLPAQSEPDVRCTAVCTVQHAKMNCKKQRATGQRQKAKTLLATRFTRGWHRCRLAQILCSAVAHCAAAVMMHVTHNKALRGGTLCVPAHLHLLRCGAAAARADVCLLMHARQRKETRSKCYSHVCSSHCACRRVQAALALSQSFASPQTTDLTTK